MFGGGFMFIWWIVGIALVVWLVKSLIGGNQHGAVGAGGRHSCCEGHTEKKEGDK